jgi:hypothetical protein
MDASVVLQETISYELACNEQLVKTAKIRKLPNGSYRVLSQDGKNLGTYKSREGAKKRLKQVEFFKHFDHSSADDKEVIDLTDIDEFSFSAIMRKLRKKASKERVMLFLAFFKSFFDKAVKNKLHNPEKIALQNAVVKFNKVHKIRLDKKMIKNATIAEMGNAKQVGKYLSDIVRFIINRLPPEKQVHAIESLKQKFSVLSEAEIASKQLPQSSALGQSITFVKHVLFNHDARYIREVLNAIVGSL